MRIAVSMVLLKLRNYSWLSSTAEKRGVSQALSAPAWAPGLKE